MQQEHKPETLILVPLTTILRIEKVDRSNTHFMFGGENSYSVDIYTKDFRRTFRFALNPDQHSRKDICDYLSSYINPPAPSVSLLEFCVNVFLARIRPFCKATCKG